MNPSRRFGLYALTLGAFAIGTTEFVPMGLLPEIARDLHVTIPLAGFLVTAYALGVAVGAPVFTLMFNRVNRKTALALLLLFSGRASLDQPRNDRTLPERALHQGRFGEP